MNKGQLSGIGAAPTHNDNWALLTGSLGAGSGQSGSGPAIWKGAILVTARIAEGAPSPPLSLRRERARDEEVSFSASAKTACRLRKQDQA